MNGDEVLARELRKKPGRALEALYDRYAPALLSISLRYCGNIQDAEDVLHDGFIKILKHIHTFKPTASGSFEGWIKRIIVNTALTFLRDRNRDRLFTEIKPVAEGIGEEPEGMNPWEELHAQVGTERLMQMICALPPGYRTVFNLYVMEGFSHKEIAEQLQISENTSKSQLSKARVLLRRQILAVTEKQKAG